MQASIDQRKASEGVSSVGGDILKPSPGSDAAENSKDLSFVDGKVSPESGGIEGKKRQRSKDDWRTYRHKKMSPEKQQEEDEWYGKPSVGGNKIGGLEQVGSSVEALSGEVGEVSGGEARVMGSRANTASRDHGEIAAEAGDDACGENEEGGDGGDYEVEKTDGSADAADTGEAGPEKVLLLRELRTRYKQFFFNPFFLHVFLCSNYFPLLPSPLIMFSLIFSVFCYIFPRLSIESGVSRV